MKENKSSKSPEARRKFLRNVGTLIAGGGVLAIAGALSRNAYSQNTDYFWQIDPQKCTFCGNCETNCVLAVSAVKCINTEPVCGYCDLCPGYYRANVKTLDTAAENLLCPTSAITRRYVEDPYFEYIIDEKLCNGCGKCCKGCGDFGNGSMYLQIKQELCTLCNECSISRVCPSEAIQRVPVASVYKLKQ
ncbi:MAG: ferredoxin [Tannerella sp.]|jgi:electron transport complex protein RnfB|nr:ferredoxin [Tannerella sp.]